MVDEKGNEGTGSSNDGGSGSSDGSSGASNSSGQGGNSGSTGSSSVQGNPPNEEESWKRLDRVVRESVRGELDERLKNWQPPATSPQQGTTTTGQSQQGSAPTAPARSQRPTRKLGFLERHGLFGDPAEILKRSRQG